MRAFYERNKKAVFDLIILIAANALPVGLMCFICILAQPLMGVTSSLAESAAYWANYLFFFVILLYVTSPLQFPFSPLRTSPLFPRPTPLPYPFRKCRLPRNINSA